MGELLNQVNAHLQSMSNKQRFEEWQKFKKYNKAGPNMLGIMQENLTMLTDKQLLESYDNWLAIDDSENCETVTIVLIAKTVMASLVVKEC
jgi:hypothetical protein